MYHDSIVCISHSLSLYRDLPRTTTRSADYVTCHASLRHVIRLSRDTCILHRYVYFSIIILLSIVI